MMEGFHAKDGLHFKRLDDGSVKMTKYNLVTKNIEFQMILPSSTWCSMVCCVSNKGECDERLYHQIKFHNE